MSFLKPEMYTDAQTQRQTAVINAGPSYTEYLYYSLDVECMTLNCSLLQALSYKI